MSGDDLTRRLRRDGVGIIMALVSLGVLAPAAPAGDRARVRLATRVEPTDRQELDRMASALREATRGQAGTDGLVELEFQHQPASARPSDPRGATASPPAAPETPVKTRRSENVPETPRHTRTRSSKPPAPTRGPAPRTRPATSTPAPRGPAPSAAPKPAAGSLPNIGGQLLKDADRMVKKSPAAAGSPKKGVTPKKSAGEPKGAAGERLYVSPAKGVKGSTGAAGSAPGARRRPGGSKSGGVGGARGGSAGGGSRR